VSLDQLRYFVAVAEEGHLTRAAARLHISQPPLTRQIKSLEDELGVALFERTPKGMRLLPAARVLLDRAKGILASLDATVMDVRAAARESTEIQAGESQTHERCHGERGPLRAGGHA
jgi:DNA-binding transcriptional LysR family regulator